MVDKYEYSYFITAGNFHEHLAANECFANKMLIC